MEILEITGYRTGLDASGVNFLNPTDAFEELENGFIYRQILQSRLGFIQFANQLGTQSGETYDATRVMGIFEFINSTGIKICLAITKRFLYQYVSVTNTFNQVPMAGNAPPGGFAVTNSAAYVSGTNYPSKTGSPRFIFTSFAMSDVYFFDGTNVQSFTLDNRDYQAPSSGPLTNAVRVNYFGSRLNFYVPTIGGKQQFQSILYSGINDNSGNGDNFNVPGSGISVCDTGEEMTAALILGDKVNMKFTRSDWILEKTRDPFNPYFTRKIPSVLGTDAGFSSVQWNYEIKSLGQNGALTCDGRRSLRCDNRIPFFTRDNFDQLNFDLSYGGFLRSFSQFMFAYRSNETVFLDSITQDKVLVLNYEESTWSVNDQRFSCFGQSDEGQNLTWEDIYEANNPSWIQMDTTEDIWDKVGIGASVQKTLAGDDKGFVYVLNQDYFDYFVTISAISISSNAVISVSPCSLQIGDKIIIQNVAGMTEINDKQPNIIAVTYGLDGTTVVAVTVNINTLLYSTYMSGGNISKLISFEASMTPFNPYRSIGRKVYVSHVEFLLDSDGGPLTVSAYDDEDESAFKIAELIPENTPKLRQWLTMAVDQESNFITFVLSANQVSNQTVITSTRIHYRQGSLTNG